MPLVYGVRDPRNIQRVVERLWDRAISYAPNLLSLLGNKNIMGSEGKHEYTNQYYAPQTVIQESATAEGVVTIAPLSDLKYFKVGDELQLENDALIAKITNITATDFTLEVVASTGSVLITLPTGPATWVVLPRKIRDGSILYDGQTMFKQDKIVWNGVQTYRKYVQLTETLQDTMTYDESSKLVKQLANIVQQTVRDINKTIIFGPVRDVSANNPAYTGSCGGFSWLASIDESHPDYSTADGCAKLQKETPGPLAWGDVGNMLSQLAEWDSGNFILVVNGATQKHISENWVDGKPTWIVQSTNDRQYGKYINSILNPYTGASIPVVTDMNVPANQAFLFNANSVSIAWRLRPEARVFERGQLTDFDGNAVRLLTKHTIEWANSFANVGVIYGLVQSE